MAGTGDELEKWVTEVIFGRARGFAASVTRGVLFLFSLLFRLLVKARLRLIRSGWKPSARLATTVVSIGNLTMGGTGKTPVTELLSRALQKRGRRIAILSRGYKSRDLPEVQRWRHPESDREFTSPPKIVSDGQTLLLDVAYAGDEPYMLAKNLPGVAV
ncbi:MAG: tetraacyldisaccharide 4'-kinase, partial [Verrucomicrobiales bacterium]